VLIEIHFEKKNLKGEGGSFLKKKGEKNQF